MKKTTQTNELNLPDENTLNAEDRLAAKKLAALALELTGVQLDDRHFHMISSRFGKRAHELGLNSLTEYLHYYTDNKAAETPKLIGLLTTHHTYFFREFSHFEYIKSHVLPALVKSLENRTSKTLNIWTAACSRGQETYSLAMFLDFHLKEFNPNFKFKIFATDVDSESVEVAKNGVYLKNELKEAPMIYLQDHWAKGTGEIDSYIKAKKSLRDRCQFDTANLLKLKPSSEKFDIIFCRNVFIYFDQEQIKNISNELLSRLTPQGYLFIGISESLSGMNLEVGSPSPSVYQHKAEYDAKRSTQSAASKTKSSSKIIPIQPFFGNDSRNLAVPAPQTKIPNPIRVLCVDDSSSILTILKQILTKQDGYEIVGTAKNGIEAAKLVKELKPDIMTLDIHMPEQDGIEYLTKNFSPTHPPVVMLTSVSRDNSDIAAKAINLGASDYVEKPALTSIEESSEEIRNKLRCAIIAGSTHKQSSFDKAIQSHLVMTKPEKKLCVISASLSHRKHLRTFFSESIGPQPPAILLLSGAKDAIHEFAKILSKETGKPFNHIDTIPAELKLNEVYLIDAKAGITGLTAICERMEKTSVVVYGEATKSLSDKLKLLPNTQIIIEDHGSHTDKNPLKSAAQFVVPCTSFAYHSIEYLSEKKAA